MAALLRSPRFVLAILASGTAYAAAGAWLPWLLPGDGPPRWAVAAGLDHPFSALPFLACVVLLFASTLACTWGRRARIAAALRGDLPAAAVALPRGAADVRAFLRAQGFRGDGDVLRRHGFALWGGWVLHVGLLVVIAAAAVQQALHDGGTFDLVEGQTARLRDPAAVAAREHGPLAPAAAPELAVTLVRFDPYLHEQGYAPDRRSVVRITRPGAPPSTATLDRAEGLRVGPVDLYQAIPTGLSLLLEVDGLGRMAVNLQDQGRHVAAITVRDPSGAPARLVATAERDLDDPLGTGPLAFALEQAGRRTVLAPGVPFELGGRPARLAGVARWGRFTWSRSPGLGGVLAGVVLVLGGSALLAFPAGVARILPDGEEAAARVFVPRGREVLLSEWRAAGGTA